MPRPIIVATKDEPPAETKGRGIPVMGRSPRFIPIWTNVWIRSVVKNPEIKALTEILMLLGKNRHMSVYITQSY